MEGICPYCGGLLSDKSLWTVADYLRLAPGHFEFHSCSACGSLALQPVPSAESLRGYYPDSYIFPAGKSSPVGETLRRYENALFYRPMLRLDAEIVGKLGLIVNARILDVGSGEGRMAAFLRDLGFDVEGLELSLAAAHSARERFGIAVHTASLEEHARQYRGKYDVLTMYNVLEHFGDVSSALSAARDLIRKDGWLVLKVPLCDGLSVKMLGRRHICVREAPRHVTLPSYRGLEALLARAGFEIRQAHHSSLISRAGLIGLSFAPAGVYARAVRRSRAGYLKDRILAAAAAAIGGIPIALLESILRRPTSIILAAQVRS